MCKVESSSFGKVTLFFCAAVGPDTPTLKGGLKLGYEMLRDAQMSTPPLVFNIDSEVLTKPSISAESNNLLH